ncbi:MAG: tRNA (adenosine(37)-N6)-threonylcarbamoyltransferase complex ATPase subunit type 1 TsaE [Candidatus Zambryskibacteria bacterium]|nr:tRNA (adenosine(37)-N6)-threonylcarbamoyltransferase complex ATPase subunit type 1 TsaE [Candidatus Zambryskibacteria bacterium]
MTANHTEKLSNLKETQSYAEKFLESLSSKNEEATVVGLYGDLGAGKTTFAQGLARALGVFDTIVSPTFVIMKIYEIPSNIKLLTSLPAQTGNFKHLIHIDAYRLEKSAEMLHLGWKEIISNPENLVVVEWPERIEDIMPPHIKIMLRHVSENEREVEVINLKF